MFSGSVAERRGFEPRVGYEPTHAFQACDLNHSSISPGRGSIASGRRDPPEPAPRSDAAWRDPRCGSRPTYLMLLSMPWIICRCPCSVGSVLPASTCRSLSLPDFASFWKSDTSVLWSATMPLT